MPTPSGPTTASGSSSAAAEKASKTRWLSTRESPSPTARSSPCAPMAPTCASSPTISGKTPPRDGCPNRTARQWKGKAVAMNKVFHFDAPREKYQCDAAVIWCFDNRFDLGFRKFLKRIGVANSDPIKIAGGAKCLASPDLETERQFVLEQIRKSMRLHGTRRVILMLHSDCGAYNGL